MVPELQRSFSSASAQVPQGGFSNAPQSDAARMRELLDASSDAIAKIDRDWNIAYLNVEARKMLAASGDILGKNHWKCFPSSAYDGSPWLKHYSLAMDEKCASAFDEFTRHR